MRLRELTPFGYWTAFVAACLYFAWPGGEPTTVERGLFALGVAILFRLQMLADELKGE